MSRHPIPLRLLLLSFFAFLVPVVLRAQEDPLATARAILARQHEIEKILERYRERPFKHEVPAGIQSDEEFRAYCRRSLDEEFSDEEAKRYTRALQVVGLLPPGFDLKERMIELMSTQAGAYYDPETKTFHVLKTDFPPKKLEPMVLHELAHALQDQYHDIGTYMKRLSRLDSDDRTTAYRFLVEGEAQYLGTLHELKLTTPIPVDNLPPGALDGIFRSQAGIHRSQMKSLLESGPATGQMTETERKAVEQQLQMPAYLYHTLVDPYARGAWLVRAAYRRGGWQAIDALFVSPPVSTEQALHPEKLLGERDMPVFFDIDDGLVEGEGVFETTIGELGILSLLEEHLPERMPTQAPNPLAMLTGGGTIETEMDAAAAGWDGDRFRVVERPDGTLVLLGITTWDSPEDANEFAHLYEEVQRRKREKLERHLGGDLRTRVLVSVRGSDVAIVETYGPGRIEGVDAILAALFDTPRTNEPPALPPLEDHPGGAEEEGPREF